MSTATGQVSMYDFLKHFNMERLYKHITESGSLELHYYDAMVLLYEVGCSFGDVDGYLYHLNRIFSCESRDIFINWQEKEITIDSEPVLIPIGNAYKIEVWVTNDSVLFHIIFGETSSGDCISVAIRFSFE